MSPRRDLRIFVLEQPQQTGRELTGLAFAVEKGHLDLLLRAGAAAFNSRPEVFEAGSLSFLQVHLLAESFRPQDAVEYFFPFSRLVKGLVGLSLETAIALARKNRPAFAARWPEE